MLKLGDKVKVKDVSGLRCKGIVVAIDNLEVTMPYGIYIGRGHRKLRDFVHLDQMHEPSLKYLIDYLDKPIHWCKTYEVSIYVPFWKRLFRRV